MNGRRIVLEVARWEFSRNFRPKDLLLNLLLGVALASVFGAAQRWMTQRGTPETRVAVFTQQPEPTQLEAPPESGIRLIPSSHGDPDALRAAVGRGGLDGLLVLRDADHAELTVRSKAPWQDRLRDLLDARRRRERLARSGLSSAQLAALFAPVQLEVRSMDAAARPDRTGAMVAGIVFTVLMLYGVFFGSSYLFAGITGEKQLRVTEQIVAAITPGAWLDGKILGLGAVAFAALAANLGVGVLGFLIVGWIGGHHSLPSLPSIHAADALVLACLSLLGFLFWFTFMAGVAATSDDPNQSARGAILFLPFLPAGLAGPAFANPDAAAVKLLSLLPVTAPVLLPIRMLLSTVAAWEIPLAILLLLGSIYLLRNAAARMFALGILMYGKEPTWREILDCLRQA